LIYKVVLMEYNINYFLDKTSPLFTKYAYVRKEGYSLNTVLSYM